MPKTIEIMQQLEPVLPKNKVRYTMGVGMSPQDLIDVVAKGADIFDCVAPTRNARHGSLYCGEILETANWLEFKSDYPNQRISIKRAEFATDELPIMSSCSCYTCKNYSRAYLHALFKRKDERFSALASIHNIAVMNSVCNKMRDRIITVSARKAESR
jgi:queuine tRNA-ribosyltransferase